jgi:copper chaperone
MKKITTILVLILTVTIVGCGKSDKQTTENKTDKTTDHTSGGNTNLQTSGSDKSIEIHTSGMTCTGCEGTIKSKVKKVEGVKDVIANHKSNTVNATYDPAKTNPEKIKEAITAAGYKVESAH